MAKNTDHVIVDPTNKREDQLHALCRHCQEKMILPLPMDMGRSGQLMITFSKVHADCKKTING